MPEPIRVNALYPTTENICPDAFSLRIISPAYAGSDGELNAVLQYIYHAFFFDKKGYGDIAKLLRGIALAEMRHLDILGETILALGAAPIYSRYPASSFNFYSSKYVSYSCSLKNMLEDDILGERRAVTAYKKMLCCLKNEQVKAIISRILEDEILHVEKLEAALVEFIR